MLELLEKISNSEAATASEERVDINNKLTKAEAKGPGTLLTSEAAIHVVGNEKPAVLYEMLTLLM